MFDSANFCLKSQYDEKNRPYHTKIIDTPHFYQLRVFLALRQLFKNNKKHWKICDHTFRSWKRQESKEKENNWYSVCTYVCHYPWESTTRDSKNFLICWSSALLVYSEWNNRKGVAVRKMRMHYPDAFSLSSRGDRRWWFGG